jgi:AraC-like DNA-binding protein
MTSRKPASIAQVRWQPGGAYALAVQAFTIARLRGKASREHFESPQRVHFYVLTGVTRGRTRHEIDFRPIDAAPGTWMLLRPGQIQRFDFSRDWDGWMIVFRPDLLPPLPMRGRGPAAGTGALEPLLAGLTTAQHLPRAVHARCAAAARRIDDDARRHGTAVDACDALLRYELGELLARVALAAPAAKAGRAAQPQANASANRHARAQGSARMAQLRALVQSQPAQRHSADTLAAMLACSAKTLGRTVRDATGLSLKAWLDEQAVLEAQRLLVHGDEPVKRVADHLGFADAGNFVKFFARVAGTTPAAFRVAQRRP